MFTTKSLDLLSKLRCSPEETNDYPERFSRDILLPFQSLIQDITEFMYELEPNIDMPPGKKGNISRSKSAPFSSGYDSVTAVFKRDRNVYPSHPFIKVAVTPYHYSIQISCASFCRDLMDTIRLMAIDGTEKFMKAWAIITGSNNIHLSGKRFSVEPDTRFYYYPDEKIKFFLAYRDFCVHVCYDLETLICDDFSERLKRQILYIMPVYEFLLSAAESAGRYPSEPGILKKWNIHPREIRKLNM